MTQWGRGFFVSRSIRRDLRVTKPTHTRNLVLAQPRNPAAYSGSLMVVRRVLKRGVLRVAAAHYQFRPCGPRLSRAVCRKQHRTLVRHKPERGAGWSTQLSLNSPAAKRTTGVRTRLTGLGCVPAPSRQQRYQGLSKPPYRSSTDSLATPPPRRRFDLRGGDALLP